MKLTELFQNMADTIRSSHYDKKSKIKATDFPDKIQEACDNRETIGYDAGMQVEYDRFWDSFQQNGTRNNYRWAFAGDEGWDNNILKPKYDIAPTNADSMFRSSKKIDDLTGLGIRLDFSKAQYMSYAFYDTNIKHIGVVNLTSAAADTHELFKFSEYLHTIDEIVVNENVTFQSGSFGRCPALANVAFNETIGSSIGFSDSPLLTAKSLCSILTALSKDITYASGKTLTLNTASQAVIEADSGCSEQLAQAISAGWTIAYV